MISITNCEIKDCSILSELSHIIWHECYKNMLSYEQRVYMLDKFLNTNSFQKQINNNINFKFAYFNNELCGYFGYKILEDHLYLHKLYIKDTFRGNGIFTYILKYLEKYKLDIKLNTCKYNPTLKIYLHVGFEIYSEEKHDIGCGFFMDDYNLIKKIK